MRFLIVGLAFVLGAVSVSADTVNIRKDRAAVAVPTAGGELAISRVQDTEHELSGEWARTSRPCPPFCIQPMTPAVGVTTIGEIELLDILETGGVVIDSRTADWFERGSIPGAINMPYTEAVDHLAELGCELDFDGWICEQAVPVALFCNGPWCGQSPSAIRRMIEAGYPADKISYYRAGMQGWRMLGLTVTGD